MLVLLALHLVAALAAPAAVRWWGRRAFYPLAAVPAAAAVWAAAHTSTIRGGGVVSETHTWVPALDLSIALRMNALAWLLVLLVGGVGALVLAYCARYFSDTEPSLGRFAAVFVGFAGAMLGLVVSDDLIVLYIFWELTTVFSYLLIAHDPRRRASRRAAGQALIVTTFGGLAMLIGMIMLGEAAGSYRLSQIVADPPPAGGYLGTALALVLIGALSKSAIFPFSFWLPSAMAAPTPVSAYLHAAAMVKAGVFLIDQFTPYFAGEPPWRAVCLTLGTATALMAGWSALRQTDLKLLLAHGTVSQLGLLVAISGAGGRNAALAAATMLLAHALFKAPLFLVVGIIDRTTGTRDLRALDGSLRRTAPGLAVVAALAAASMAGVPPLLGFVGKEAVFTALLRGGTGDRIALVGLVAAAALTAAYSARLLWGAFADKPAGATASGAATGVAARPAGAAPSPVDGWFLAPAALLALAGLALGPLAVLVDESLAAVAAPAPASGPAYHLSLWHGLTPALGLSTVALAGGVLLFLWRDRVDRWVAVLRAPRDGTWSYDRIMRWVDRAAVEVTGATQRGSLPLYLGSILVVLVVVPGGAMLAGPAWPERIKVWDTPLQVVVATILIAAAVLAVRAQRRLTAMILVGVTGYGTAMMFVLYGAPDLALTQFLVETFTIVLFVLVLRRLPSHFSERPLRTSRYLRIGMGIAVGVVVSGLAYVAAGARLAPSVSGQFPDQAVSFGHGRNVVNVILVDIRAWDTMGEVSVLVVAATGVASLIFRRPRTGPQPRRGGAEPEAEWLPAVSRMSARGRSIIFEVVTRLVFHAIVLYSIYLLFSGHNAPGGGFSGGLVAGLALAVRYLAGGRYELTEAAPVDAGLVLGTGLLLAVGSGAAAMLLGGEMLQSAVIDLHLPVIGDVHLVTSLFFDIGVYLVVIGLILDILRSLGAEVDRQPERAGSSS